jgi:PilZ domain
MGRRREPRVKLEIPVKVCGMDTSGHPFVQTAYAVSISRTGVRLTGVGPLVRLGETVVVIYKQRKARFRVAWIGEVGQPEFGDAGLEAADPSALVWDFPLPHPAMDGFISAENLSAMPAPAAGSREKLSAGAQSPQAHWKAEDMERRNSSRFKCRGSAEIFVPSVSFPTRGQIDDISLSGVYIQATAPLPVGNDVKLSLAIQGTIIQAEAQVRTSHPGVGMGLMFTNLTPENNQILAGIIRRLGGAPANARAGGSVPDPQAKPNVSLRWDALGRGISDWFRTHETLSREEFYEMVRGM